MDKLKSSLDPFLATLNQALELVKTVDKFSSDQLNKKFKEEKEKIDKEIACLRKETDIVKNKIISDEQELKLKEAKIAITSNRIKETRQKLKKLKKEEEELRIRYVESFSVAVKKEPRDDGDLAPDAGGSDTEPSPPRKKRKRIIQLQDVENDLIGNDGVVYEEDIDSDFDVEYSTINSKTQRELLAIALQTPQRDPFTYPFLYWINNPEMEIGTSSVINSNGSSSNTHKGFRIPKSGIKRELEPEVPQPSQPKRGRKPGVTGGRRSLGGDGVSGCKYCDFKSMYSANVVRHIKTRHPEQYVSGDSGSQDSSSMSVLSISVTESQVSDDGSTVIPVKKAKGGKRKKWLIQYQTEDGRVFQKCTKNHVFECKECQWSTAYRQTIIHHIRKKHLHLMTTEEAEDRNRNIDWTKFMNKLKVKQIKVPNTDPSKDEVTPKKEPESWDYSFENDMSLVNGSQPGLSGGSGDVDNVNTSFQLLKPKRYKRQSRNNVEDLYSEFKKRCIDNIHTSLPLTHQEILDNAFDVSHFENMSFESDSSVQGFNYDDVEELCIVLKKYRDRKFRTFSFRKTQMIMVDNNITCEDLSLKFDHLQMCRNLKVLAVSGLGSIHEQLVETALYSLGQDCPNIEHFIVDDNIAIIKSYVDTVVCNKIKIIEVSNRPEDEQDMLEVITNCPELDTVCLEDVSIKLLQALTPRVSRLSMTWITKDHLESFITMSATSNIAHLKMDCTHVSLKRSHIRKLAKSLPQLQSIYLSWDLDQIHCLKYFNRGVLNAITWDTIPFDVERDVATGNLIKEKPLSYWMEDDCEHSFTQHNPKRVLSSKARLPDDDGVSYGLQIQSFNNDQGITNVIPDASLLVPTLDECLEKRSELVVDDNDKTEVDSQATIESEVTEKMELEDQGEKNESKEDESSSLLDLSLINSPSASPSIDSDDEIFRNEVTEDPIDDYLEYRQSRARLSVKIMSQRLGDSLTTLKLTIKDALPNDIFECLAENCPNLLNLSITSMCDTLTFSPNSFFIPQLMILETSGIIFRDSELIDILDQCVNLERLVMEEAVNISTNAIRIIQAYSETRLGHRLPLPPVEDYPDFQNPLADPNKIQVQISTRGNENYDIVNVYSNLVFKFVVKKRTKILRKY